MRSRHAPAAVLPAHPAVRGGADDEDRRPVCRRHPDRRRRPDAHRHISARTGARPIGAALGHCRVVGGRDRRLESGRRHHELEQRCASAVRQSADEADRAPRVLVTARSRGSRLTTSFETSGRSFCRSPGDDSDPQGRHDPSTCRSPSRRSSTATGTTVGVSAISRDVSRSCERTRGRRARGTDPTAARLDRRGDLRSGSRRRVHVLQRRVRAPAGLRLALGTDRQADASADPPQPARRDDEHAGAITYLRCDAASLRRMPTTKCSGALGRLHSPSSTGVHPICRDNEIIGAVVTFLDITERQRPRRRFRGAYRREQFLAMLSHELRNPLSAILSAARLIAGESGWGLPRRRGRRCSRAPGQPHGAGFWTICSTSRRSRMGASFCGPSSSISARRRSPRLGSRPADGSERGISP